MRFSLFIATAALLPIAATAQATTTTFSSQGTFSAAAGPVSTETFQGCPSSTTSFSGNVSSSVGPCSGILPGVTYSPAQGSLYIAGAGQSSNPTTALGLDVFSGDPITINFAAGTTAFGANLYQNFGGGNQSGSDAAFLILAYGAGNVLLGTFNPNVASGGGSFFGLTSTDAIFSVKISQPTGFAVIDNVQFKGGVPEPGTWAMMLLGFAGIGVAFRRNRSRRQAYAA